MRWRLVNKFVLQALPLSLWHIINTSAFPLGRYEPSSPSSTKKSLMMTYKYFSSRWTSARRASSTSAFSRRFRRNPRRHFSTRTSTSWQRCSTCLRRRSGASRTSFYEASRPKCRSTRPVDGGQEGRSRRERVCARPPSRRVSWTGIKCTLVREN